MKLKHKIILASFLLFFSILSFYSILIIFLIVKLPLLHLFSTFCGCFRFKININFDNDFNHLNDNNFFHFFNFFLYFIIFAFIFMFITIIFYYFEKNRYLNEKKIENFSFHNHEHLFSLKNFLYYYLFKENFLNRISIKNMDDSKDLNFKLLKVFSQKIGNFNYTLILDNEFYTFRSNTYFSSLNVRSLVMFIQSCCEFAITFYAFYKLLFLYYKFDLLLFVLNFNENFLSYNRLNFKGFVEFSLLISISFILALLFFSFFLWLFESMNEKIVFKTEQDSWFFNSFFSHLRVFYYIFIFFLFLSFGGLTFFNMLLFCTFQIPQIFKESVFFLFDLIRVFVQVFERVNDNGLLNPSFYVDFFYRTFELEKNLFFSASPTLFNQSNLSILLEQELWKYELLMDIRKRNRFINDTNELIIFNHLINKNFLGFGIKLDNVHVHFEPQINFINKQLHFRSNSEIFFDPLFNPLLSENSNKNSFFSFNPDISINSLRLTNYGIKNDFPDEDGFFEDTFNFDEYDNVNKNLIPLVKFINKDIRDSWSYKYDYIFQWKGAYERGEFNNWLGKSDYVAFFFTKIIQPIKDWTLDLKDFFWGYGKFNFGEPYMEDMNEFTFFEEWVPEYAPAKAHSIFFSNKKDLKFNYYNFFELDNKFSNRYIYGDVFFKFLSNELIDKNVFQNYNYINIFKVEDNYSLFNLNFLKPFFFSKKIDVIKFHYNWLNSRQIVFNYFSSFNNLFNNFDEELFKLNYVTLNSNFFKYLNQFETNKDNYNFYTNTSTVSNLKDILFEKKNNNYYSKDTLVSSDNFKNVYPILWDEKTRYPIDLYEYYPDNLVANKTLTLIPKEIDLENANSLYTVENLEDVYPYHRAIEVEDLPIRDHYKNTYNRFFLVSGKIDDIQVVLGMNNFFDINKFLNIYSINDFFFSNKIYDNIIYCKNVGLDLKLEISNNHDNFFSDLFYYSYIFNEKFNSYYSLESKIQNFSFFQNTILEHYLHKNFGASLVTEGLQYQLVDTIDDFFEDLQRLMLYPSLKRSSPSFFQFIYNFDWRYFKEKFIEFPFSDYIFPYKKYKFLGFQKSFFDWKNDGTVFKNHNSDYLPQFVDYIDDTTPIFFQQFEKIRFYHRDLLRSFMLGDFASTLILKDYQHALFYDKKNYFLNEYFLNLIVNQIDLQIYEFIKIYKKYINFNKNFLSNPVVTSRKIYPLLRQNDIFILKRTFGDFYFRPTSFELNSIFERLNIILMDFINRLIFLDFEKRGNHFIYDLEQNNNFFNLLKIYLMLRGFDPWHLYKVNMIFDINNLDLILEDYKVNRALEKDDIIRNNRLNSFFARKFNFHVFDNLDFLLFPYRNHYIFPCRFYYYKSDLENFLKANAISVDITLKHLNDINAFNKFNYFSFLKKFHNIEHENDVFYEKLLREKVTDFIKSEESLNEITAEMTEVDNVLFNKKKSYKNISQKYSIDNLKKNTFFDKNLDSNYDGLTNKHFAKITNKKMNRSLKRPRYKTFAPRFEIGFPNNRNFFRSFIFKDLCTILFKDPYIFKLYHFPFDNAYSFFWVNFVRSILLKNQFISQIRNDRIFANEFIYNSPIYKRISFFYLLPTDLPTHFPFSSIELPDWLKEQHKSFHRAECIYPFFNWLLFEEWSNVRFKKYTFNFLKNFRIYFDSPQKIPVFFDRRGNVSFSRFIAKYGNIGDEHQNIYTSRSIKKKYNKRIVKYPDFFRIEGLFFYIQSFFSYFLDKINFTKFFIYVTDYSYYFSKVNNKFKATSGVYQISLYKRRQRYARFLDFMKDRFPSHKTYTRRRNHFFNVFYIFYSMGNIGRNFNTILSQIGARNVHSHKFRFLINKIKPTPELLILKNNEIRINKIVNQILFFKFLSNKNIEFYNKKNDFWVYFFKNNYIDTRLFDVPLNLYQAEKYPVMPFVTQSVRQFSWYFDLVYYNNFNMLLTFNMYKRINLNIMLNLSEYLCSKWSYYGNNYYGNPHVNRTYLDINDDEIFRSEHFNVIKASYFNHRITANLKNKIIRFNNEKVNIVPLGFLRVHPSLHLKGGNKFFIGFVNPNYNSFFDDFLQSVKIFKYVSKLISYNKNFSFTHLEIFSPLEYEIYRKEKFFNWLKYNRFRRILKHYNFYQPNESYLTEFFRSSDLTNKKKLHNMRDYLNRNFISDFFLKQPDEFPEDKFLNPRRKFYIPFRHEHWYYNDNFSVFSLKPFFLQNYFDVLSYYENEVFYQTLKIINLKVQYDIYKIHELEAFVDVLYNFNIDNLKKNDNINEIFFFNSKSAFLEYFLNFIKMKELFFYLILYDNKNMFYSFNKTIFYLFVTIFYYITKWILLILDFNFLNNNSFIIFLNNSLLNFWIHFYLFPIWLIVFMFFSDIGNLKNLQNHTKFNDEAYIEIGQRLDIYDKFSYSNFNIYRLPYSNELNEFFLRYRRHPNQFEIEQLMDSFKKKKKLFFSLREKPFFNKTSITSPVNTEDPLIIFYVFQKEHINQSFILFKSLQQRQMERNLRYFVQILQSEPRTVFEETESYDPKDPDTFIYRSRKAMHYKKKRKNFKRSSGTKLLKNIKVQHSKNLSYTLNLASHKNSFSLSSFLYKGSFFYIEFFFLVYLTSFIFIYLT